MNSLAVSIVFHPSKLTRLSNQRPAMYDLGYVFHPSKLTRLSNSRGRSHTARTVFHPSKLTRLSNPDYPPIASGGFFILPNLQDSQTYKTLKPQIQFQVLTELNTVTGAVSLFQIDYTIILIDNTCFFAVQFRFLYIF